MSAVQPIPMVLFCPNCGMQHIDAPAPGWDNPPHRSHLCHECGHIWRPADVATVGVVSIASAGAGDHPVILGLTSPARAAARLREKLANGIEALSGMRPGLTWPPQRRRVG